MNGVAALRERVSAKQAEIDAARQRVVMLEAEAKIWQEALALVAGDDTLAEPMRAASQRTPSLSLAPDTDGRRGPRGAWRIVMPAAVARFNGEFGYQDLEQLGAREGTPLKRQTLRAQLANYAKGGFVRRVSEGRFCFTDKGREEFSSLLPLSGHDDEPDKGWPDEDGAHSSGLHVGDSHSPDAPNATLDRGE